jgi:hypothetical protein
LAVGGWRLAAGGCLLLLQPVRARIGGWRTSQAAAHLAASGRMIFCGSAS